jgi:hypothetical protein
VITNYERGKFMSIEKPKSKYLKELCDSLEEKFTLNNYSFIDNLIECREAYFVTFEDYIKTVKGEKIIPKSERNIFGYLFNISRNFFDCLMDNIILSQYDSAHFNIRRLSENYIILSFLSANKEYSLDFFDYIDLRKYKVLVQNDYISARLTKKEKRIITGTFEKLKGELIEYFSLPKVLSKTQNDKLENILLSDYYWAHKKFKFGQNISLKQIAKISNCINDYNVFANSCNRVHSNNIIEYTMMLKSNFNEDLYLLSCFCMYLNKYSGFFKSYYGNIDFSEVEKNLRTLEADLRKLTESNIREL